MKKGNHLAISQGHLRNVYFMFSLRRSVRAFRKPNLNQYQAVLFEVIEVLVISCHMKMMSLNIL